MSALTRRVDAQKPMLPMITFDTEGARASNPGSTAAVTAMRSILVGTKMPGKNARGISFPGFMRAFPDEESCLEFLFWVRGGHDVPCPSCGRAASWALQTTTLLFASDCCGARLNAKRGTFLARSRKPTWLWFYTIMLTLNLSASPSSVFLSRHLDLDCVTTWTMLHRIREQLWRICNSGSRALVGRTVCVENLRFRRIRTAGGRKVQLAVNVFIVATADNAFAYAMPKRHPRYYRRLLDQLGVDRTIYTFDFDFADIATKLQAYDVRLFTRQAELNSPEVWPAFANGRSLACYIYSGFRKGPGAIRRQYLQHYLADFVFRFNFANDKAMMFPLLLSSLEPISSRKPRNA